MVVARLCAAADNSARTSSLPVARQSWNSGHRHQHWAAFCDVWCSVFAACGARWDGPPCLSARQCGFGGGIRVLCSARPLFFGLSVSLVPRPTPGSELPLARIVRRGSLLGWLAGLPSRSPCCCALAHGRGGASRVAVTMSSLATRPGPYPSSPPPGTSVGTYLVLYQAPSSATSPCPMPWSTLRLLGTARVFGASPPLMQEGTLGALGRGPGRFRSCSLQEFVQRALGPSCPPSLPRRLFGTRHWGA